MAPRVVVAVLLLVLDLPAGRAAEVAAYVAAVLLLIVLGTMSLWVIALEKRLRVSRSAEAALRNALRTSEEKFDKAFRSSSECIALSNFAGVEILEVNDQFEQLTGYSRAEVLGRTLADLGFIDGQSINAWMDPLER